jgi:NAD(P)-dependent dehydrogenase (short-subunit alcohol dehydrogenase family)
LLSLGETKQVGDRIAAEEPHIDVLINNAGNIFLARAVMVDGLERTFALNHMAYFVLPHRLRERRSPRPRRASSIQPRPRIRANTSISMTCRWSTTAPGRHTDAPNLPIFCSRANSWRGLAGTGVTANCLHPGFVATGFGQRDSVIFGSVMRLSMLFAGNPEQGARTIIHLAASA